jgi:hypothetical protein
VSRGGQHRNCGITLVEGVAVRERQRTVASERRGLALLRAEPVRVCNFLSWTLLFRVRSGKYKRNRLKVLQNSHPVFPVHRATIRSHFYGHVLIFKAYITVREEFIRLRRMSGNWMYSHFILLLSF